MAEVLGVVASGIAVVDAAGQIGSGILKLRRLWSEVKDVPDTINSLMQQLELLAVVIGEMETIQHSSTGDATRPLNSQGMQLSMTRCREAMNVLEHLVSNLTHHVNSQKRLKRAKAKLKVALEKDALNQCHKRLSNAVQLLQVAQGCYQMSMTGIVLQRLITAPMGPESSQQHRNVGVQLSATEEVDKSCSQEVTYRRMGSPIPSWQNIKRTFGPFAAYAWNSCRTEDELGFERQEVYIRLELAKWLSGKSWEVQIARSISGWHHYLRTYNIVTGNSEAIQCVERGDLPHLKYLLSNKLASIYDRTENGHTLLWYAVAQITEQSGEINQELYDVMRFLVTCGLDINERPVSTSSSLQLCLYNKRWNSYLPWLTTCWKSSEIAANTDEPGMIEFLHWLRFTSCSTFMAFQPVIQPDFYVSPLPFRVKTHLNQQLSDAGLFRIIVHRDSIFRKEDVVELIGSGFSLLNTAVWSFFTVCSTELYDHIEWTQLMHDLILVTDDLHFHLPGFDSITVSDEEDFIAISGEEDSTIDGPTLWVCILSTAYNFSDRDIPYRVGRNQLQSIDEAISSSVLDWLEILQDCKVDLASYGQREHEIIFGGARHRHAIRAGRGGSCMWTGFSWGPEPEDWTIHLDPVVERYARDFWQLVDDPLLHIPGAWVDDEIYLQYWSDTFSEISWDESEHEFEDESEVETDSSEDA